VSHCIAITGKGGTGKTTVAGLVIRGLAQRGRRPVLGVDADPNSCLDGVLGVRVESTVGGVREEARQIASQGMSSGVSKQRLLEMKISQSLVEGADFDLIAMGRPEGPGCYCYANNVLGATISQLSSQYPYVVIDNEAGLENLSRRIVQDVDVLVMVSDPSRRGLETVRRLHELAREMDVAYGQLVILVNRLRRGELPEGTSELQAATGADCVMGLQDDEDLADYAERGESLWKLPRDNRVIAGIDSFLDQAGLG